MVMALRQPDGAREIDAASPVFVHRFARDDGDLAQVPRQLSEALAELGIGASCRSTAAVVTKGLCDNAASHGGRRGRIELRVAPPVIVVDVVDEGAWLGRLGSVFGPDDVPSRGRGLTRALELCEDVSISCLVGETRVRCTIRDGERRSRRMLGPPSEARS